MGAARADRELEPRREVGDLGRLPGARAPGPDDVRPDDRGVLDLHRDPGDPAGHLRDVRRAGAPALRRHARGSRRPDRRPRRHGRRAAARGDDERGRLPRDRGRRGPRPAPARHRLRRPADRHDPAEALAWAREAAAAGAGRIDRARRQRRRDRAGAGPRPASGSTSSPTRRPPTTRSPATSRRRSRSTTPRSLRRTQPDEYVRRSMALDGRPRPGDARVPGGRRGRLRLRQQPAGAGADGRRRERVRLPGLRAGVHPAAVLRGARAVPLGGAERRPGRHRPHRPGDPGAVPGRRGPPPLDRRWPRREGAVPGPAGADLLAGLRRAGQGRRWRSTSWSRRGEVRAPIVIGRDHLDAGSVASPNRETEAMADGSDAVADWPLLNALVNTAAGATWVSIHHGGGVGIGYSQHAGMVVVADGTELARAEAGAGAHDGSRDGRRAPRGRGLRAGDRGRPRARRPRSRCWTGSAQDRRRAGPPERRPSPGSPSPTRPGIVLELANRRRAATGRNAIRPPMAPDPDRLVEADDGRQECRPTIWPSGIVPHTMKRIVAFIWPCIRGRRDRLAQADLVDVPGHAEEAADEAAQRRPRGTAQASGAIATGRPERLKPNAVSTSVRPTPESRPSAGWRSARATRTPTEPIEKANPMRLGAEAALADAGTGSGSRPSRCRRSSTSRSSRRWSAASDGR